MSISYTKTNWRNLPAKTAPLSATNLNKIENGIAELQTRISQIAIGEGGS